MCKANVKALLKVANHFYQGAPGAWICVSIDPSLLSSRVVYESPAPVGSTPSFQKAKEEQLLCACGGGGC